MKIYTVGDSHSWHAWMRIPGVETRSIGPMTMYSFGLANPYVVGHIPNDATVVYCWGEIDCRCHVHKHQPWDKCIDSLVENYVKVVKNNMKTHPNGWIYNVVPPPKRDESSEQFGGGFPFVGSNEDRLKYVRYMNKKLKESGLPFIDLYDKYCDEDGYLRLDISDDHVHVSDEKPIIEWIEARQKEEEW